MNRRDVVRGFTLVELLVALALLSLLMLGLLTAMRSFAQTEARIDAHIRRIEELRVSEKLLRVLVGSVSPRTQDPAAGGAKAIAFSGGAEEIRWIGVMPARHGAGGLYRFRLFIEPGEAEIPPALKLQFAPFVRIDLPLEAGSVQERVLVGGVAEVRFRFSDAARPEAEWLSVWPHTDRLPRRIAMHIRTDANDWPDIVVAVIPVVGPGVSGRGLRSGSGPVIGPF